MHCVLVYFIVTIHTLFYIYLWCINVVCMNALSQTDKNHAGLLLIHIRVLSSSVLDLINNANTNHSFTHLEQHSYTIITAFLQTNKLELNQKVFFQPKYNRCFSALQCDQKQGFPLDYFTHQSLFTGLEEAKLPMLKELYTVFCGFRGSGRTFDRLSQVVWHQKEQRSTSA